MLLSKTAKVGMRKSNYLYYQNKGYNIPFHIDKDKHLRIPRNSYLDINIDDILENSDALVEVKCDYCNKIFDKKYSSYIIGHKDINKDCCGECVSTKIKEINIQKFGTNSMKKLAIIKDFSIGRKLKFNKQEIIEYFTSKNLNVQIDLLQSDHITEHVKIPFICNNHPTKGVQYRSYDEVKNKKSCCKYGGFEESSKKQSQSSITDVEQICQKRDYILLTDEIHNVDDKVEYICKKHRDYGIQTTSLWGLKTYTYNCRMCKQASGEDHYNWKGGISNLHEYLREHMIAWKQDSFEYGNYTCVISNIRGGQLIIHHLYGFDQILRETMDSLNLPIYQEINKYADDELKSIETLCLELHYKYGLGVCICTEEHILFHSIYGYGNNTPEQFEEFKQMRLQDIHNQAS